MAQSKLDIVISSNVSRALTGIRSVTSSLAGVVGKISSIVGITGGVAAGFGIPAAFAAAIKSVLSFQEEMAALQKTLGSTTGESATLKVISAIDDISLENITSSLKTLQVNMERVAREGGDDLIKVFAEAGISIDKLKGSSLTDTLMAMSKGLSGIADGQTRAYIATQLMGRGGAQFAGVLAKGPQYIKEMIAEQERLGINWKNVAADADALGDNLDKIKLGFTGFSNGLFEVVAKDLIGATDELQKIDFVHLGEKVGQSILPVVREISGLVKGISEPGGFEHVGNAIRKALSDGAIDLYNRIKEALANTVAGRAFGYIDKGVRYIASGTEQAAAYLGEIGRAHV